MNPYNIRMEYGRTDESRICILERPTPMFSWACAASGSEQQTAYALCVSLAGTPVWQTGRVLSSEQQCRYAGPALQAGETYTLSLRLRNADGQESACVQRRFCLGHIAHWDAAWLTATDAASDAVVDFVYDFSCDAPVESACLFVCGLGYHKVELNGAAVFDDPLNPAYSQYDRRAYYSVVPELEKGLRPGKNRLAVRVAAGWRRPDSVCYDLVGRIASYTGKTQLSAMLRLRLADGRIVWHRTGETWKCLPDVIAASDLFQGEQREQTRFIPNWSCPGTPLPLLPVAITDPPCQTLLPQTLAPIRAQERYAAKSVCEVAPGVWSVDFGQNLAGVCRLKLPRDIPAGTVITLHHMEFLDEDGRLYLPQLRNAASIDTYVAAGDGKDPEYWQPEFTYHGFRYAEISGYPRPLTRGDIEAVSLYTDVFSDSFFTCGEPLLNAVFHASLQGEKSNIHSVLTDCPQRDERMGWLNDATARFAFTPYIADVGRLFPKIVRDCMDVQSSDGSITCTAPFAFGCRPADPVCSSYLIAGWQAWLHTGNLEILAEGFEGFAAWNAFLRAHSENGIVTYSYYGDWAAPAYACPDEEYAVSAVTPGILMSTGFYYYNSVLLAKIATLLEKPERAAEFEEEAACIRKAFLEKWYDPQTGRVGTGSQGCQAFALWLDILPEAGRAAAAELLHRDLVEKGFRFTTGNLCTRYMLEMLTKYGYAEDAYTLLTREEYPSIGFMLQNEATTIWERFELKKNPLMNSHNHPMYGSLSYWFFACLAGLSPQEGGWKRFSCAPCFPEKLLSASAGVPTPYGDVTLRWVRRYGRRYVYLQVPHGTRASVTLPELGTMDIGSGFYHWEFSE